MNCAVSQDIDTNIMKSLCSVNGIVFILISAAKRISSKHQCLRIYNVPYYMNPRISEMVVLASFVKKPEILDSIFMLESESQ